MIRTCLFDLGNVLVFFSHERMCEQLGRLGGQTAAEMRRQLIDSGVQWDFERGRISPAEFHNWFRKLAGRDIDAAELFRAGSDIFWPNEPMLPVLRGLKSQGVRLVLLSNTCQTHFEWVADRFECLRYFDAHVTSYQAGAIKPEAAIFEAALLSIECAPHECFYTDDIPQYVAAGEAHGLHAAVFRDVPTLLEQLRQLGVTDI